MGNQISSGRRGLSSKDRFARCVSVLVLLLAIGPTGCATLRNRNPIDEEVIIARQLSQQGVDARQDGDWTLAEERFRSAIKYCPEDHTARVHFAECLWRRGAADDATKELTKAIELSGGSDVDSIARLGEMLNQMGNKDSAAKLVAHALNVNPKNAQAWKLHASLLHDEGKLDESLAGYHRALVYAPGDAEVLASTAEIYYEANRPHRAVAVLERVFSETEMELAPTRLLHLHGLALAQLERNHEAVHSLLLARNSMGQPSAELLADLAETQIANGQVADATATIDQAFRIASAEDRIRLQELSSTVAALRREQIVR